MKRLLPLAALSVLLLAAMAQTASARERVAVVNPHQIIAQAPQAKAMRKSLHQQFDPQRHQLQALQAKVQKQHQKFQKNRSIMSKSQRQKMGNKLARLERELQTRQHQYQKALQQAERKDFAKLDKRFSSVIARIARREHYDIVLSRGVVYATHAANITDKVLAALKAKAK